MKCSGIENRFKQISKRSEISFQNRNDFLYKLILARFFRKYLGGLRELISDKRFICCFYYYKYTNLSMNDNLFVLLKLTKIQYVSVSNVLSTCSEVLDF